MTKKEAITYLKNALSPVFDEAEFMTRVLMEDKFASEPIDKYVVDQTIRQLKAGEPLQYVSGRTNFYGYFFEVTPAVLIPRPETEELVHWILKDTPPKPLRLLDIGTGSGCIPITIKKERPTWQVAGLDTSAEALAIARKNAKQLDVNITWLQLDFLQAKPSLVPDILVSNPPYVATKDPVDEHVRQHEPRLALYPPGEDPLIFYKKLGEWMKKARIPIGYFEINALLASETIALFESLELTPTLKHDLQGQPRMLKIQQPEN